MEWNNESGGSTIKIGWPNYQRTSKAHFDRLSLSNSPAFACTTLYQGKPICLEIIFCWQKLIVAADEFLHLFSTKHRSKRDLVECGSFQVLSHQEM